MGFVTRTGSHPAGCFFPCRISVVLHSQALYNALTQFMPGKQGGHCLQAYKAFLNFFVWSRSKPGFSFSFFHIYTWEQQKKYRNMLVTLFSCRCIITLLVEGCGLSIFCAKKSPKFKFSTSLANKDGSLGRRQRIQFHTLHAHLITSTLFKRIIDS